jgi:hypothetical protein
MQSRQRSPSTPEAGGRSASEPSSAPSANTDNGRLARDLGEIAQAADDNPSASWCLALALHGLDIADDRDKLPQGEWILQLLIGADDGDAQRYEVDVTWSAEAPTVDAVLAEALGRLAVRKV